MRRCTEHESLVALGGMVVWFLVVWMMKVMNFAMGRGNSAPQADIVVVNATVVSWRGNVQSRPPIV